MHDLDSLPSFRFFKWAAIAHDGNIDRGIMFALSPREVDERLFAHNRALLRCAKAGRRHKKIHAADTTILLLQHLHALIDSNLHLEDAFTALADMPLGAHTKAILSACAWHLWQGMACTRVLGAIPLFPPHLARMIGSAEKSGSLADLLPQLVEYERQKQTFRTNLRSSLFLPLCTLGLFALSFIMIMLFVLPRIRALSATLNPTGQQTSSTLPLFPIIFVCAAIIMGLAVASMVVMRSKKVAQRCYQALLRRSVLLSSWTASTLFQFMAIVVANNNRLQDSFVSCQTAFPLLQNYFAHVCDMLARGISCTDTFEARPLFHPHVHTAVMPFVRIGETTGTCAHAFKTCASHLSNTTQNRINKLMRILQPALLIIIGLCTLALVASFYIPLLSLGEQISL